MGMTRRQALATSIGVVFLSGCKSTQTAQDPQRPGPDWPDGTPATANPGSRHTVIGAPPRPAATSSSTRLAPPQAGPVYAISRTHWSTGQPIQDQVNPMNGARKITLHHEGSGVVRFTSRQATAEHLDKIRQSHVTRNGWGDIGYHYIVDRAGRVWEGRPIRYQGAHVRENNEHNIGVMALGNFDRQSPTQPQLDALFSTVRRLKRHHRIAVAEVKSHQEINATACPGRNLQKHMDAMRRHIG